MVDKPIGDFIPGRNNLGHFSVYILKHRDKKFTGFYAGVGFENGRGSTNSFQDVQKIVNLVSLKTKQKLNNVTDITEEYWTAKIEARAKKEANERKASKASTEKKENPENKEA